MPNRDVVIKGIEHCRKHGTFSGKDCNGHYEYTDDLSNIIKVDNYRAECPYGKCKTGCVVTLVDDALKLIQEQKQRIETLESLRRIEQEGS